MCQEGKARGSTRETFRCRRKRSVVPSNRQPSSNRQGGRRRAISAGVPFATQAPTLAERQEAKWQLLLGSMEVKFPKGCDGPGLKNVWILLNMGIFQPAMLVYQRVYFDAFDDLVLYVMYM